MRSTFTTVAFALLACLGLTELRAEPDNPRGAGLPNIVLILADDLGYGEVGCYGQREIATPAIDRLAQEGLRFTQFYAGSTVCAPSRSALMTGQHTGRTWVRGNASGIAQTLRDSDLTLAELLRARGYATAMFGKWGLGEEGTPGEPTRQGFDEYFGYLNQVHAHNYYPQYLLHNGQRVPLRNTVRGAGAAVIDQFTPGAADEPIDYSHDLVVDRALDFIERHRDQPFFLYLPVTLPHANNEAMRERGDGTEVPELGPYADRPWPAQDQGHAAMIDRLDRDVGRLRDALRTAGLDQNTLLLFTSDNGPHRESGHSSERFQSSGPLRGTKRALYEGGIRVPLIAVWPNHIAPATTTDQPGVGYDLLPTLCEVAGIPPPQGIDGISLLPTLRGAEAEQAQHDYLYWEFLEQGSRQAVRMGRWKAIREPMFTGPIQLFDLHTDTNESHNLAQLHPDLVARAAHAMDEAHRPGPNWTVP
jgi:uncharacterized sulfatase